MTRIEHYNDPDAPKANSLIPAASAVVANDRGEILLQRRSDNDLWSIPGGAMEPGETIRQTVLGLLRLRAGGGELRTSDESLEVGYFAPDAIEGMNMHPSIRRRISDYLAGHSAPVID